MTILEVMIVLAIIGLGAFLARRAYRAVSKADLVEDVTELAMVMRRTSQRAMELGEMHRVVFDFEKHAYIVEVCQGAATIMRNEALTKDPEKIKEQIERAKGRLNQVPDDAFATDPEEAAKKITALSGHHVADRQCAPATDGVTGDSKGWIRQLRAGRGVKLKEIWVQHIEKSTTKEQVAIYFFPRGMAEKAVVEVSDGETTFSILVHGLSGRVELREGALENVDDHMLRNVKGERDAARDGGEAR